MGPAYSWELVMDGLKNMKYGVVQAVEKVVGTACASVEERYKGQLNSEMASYVHETICSPTKPSRIGNADTFSANGYLKSSTGICYGYQKDKYVVIYR
uniref:Uncharacterized protein n=1 Tax=Timema monikensis TaxID=170555 RepID=A0A7R9HUR5_9NEOP|nr:unnamed protein product [Timema monikensis]